MPCQLQWAARDALAFLNRKAFTRLRALFSFLRLVLHRISMAPGATRRADAATGAAAGGSCAGRTNARAAHAITRTSSDKRRAMAGQRLGPALGQRAQWGGGTLFAWCLLRKLPLALSPSPLSKSFHHHALPAPVGRTHSKPLACRLEGPRYCSASGLA